MPSSSLLATPARDGGDRRITPSAVALILANLPPLYGVLVLGWDVFPLVFLFWAENVMIGVLNIVRLLVARPANGAAWLGKVFIVPFFAFHYGMFTMVHGMFVFALFGHLRPGPDGLLAPLTVLSTVTTYHLWWPLALLLASHLISFFTNYIGRGEYRDADLRAVMAQPYGRVIVLHVSILAGGFLVMALGSPVAGLAVLVLLKIAVDLRAHLKEHASEQAGAPVLSEV